MVVPSVDTGWTKKQLQAECEHRGIYQGCSRLDKAGLIRHLNAHINGRVVACDKKKEPTMAELRAECRRKGLKNYSKLKKDELIRFVTEASDGKPKQNEQRLQDLTLQQLRDECRRRGMRGYSNLKKEDIIRRMTDRAQEEQETQRRSSRAAKKATRNRRHGPLRARAQERFDAGPTPLDAPGFLYIYNEPNAAVDEWKIGKTTLDPPERRMRQSAGNNHKTYTLRASWRVPWCGYTEKIVHLDLDDLRVTPGKEKADGGGKEDGGTEWFRADIKLVEARVLLVLRMVRARAADEADASRSSGGRGGRGCLLMSFCGVFQCGLPVVRRRRSERSEGTSGKNKHEGSVVKTAAAGAGGQV